jgi:hypothetical protein
MLPATISFRPIVLAPAFSTICMLGVLSVFKKDGTFLYYMPIGSKDLPKHLRKL